MSWGWSLAVVFAIFAVAGAIDRLGNKVENGLKEIAEAKRKGMWP